MDDVILFYTDKFDAEKEIKNCYNAPLSLEDAKPDTFLETTFTISNNNEIQHWLKNENQPGQAANGPSGDMHIFTAIWRSTRKGQY